MIGMIAVERSFPRQTPGFLRSVTLQRFGEQSHTVLDWRIKRMRSLDQRVCGTCRKLSMPIPNAVLVCSKHRAQTICAD